MPIVRTPARDVVLNDRLIFRRECVTVERLKKCRVNMYFELRVDTKNTLLFCRIPHNQEMAVITTNRRHRRVNTDGVISIEYIKENPAT